MQRYKGFHRNARVYAEIQGVPSGNMGLSRGYKGIQGSTQRYKGLHRNARVYADIQGVQPGNVGLSRGYKRIHELYRLTRMDLKNITVTCALQLPCAQLDQVPL